MSKKGKSFWSISFEWGSTRNFAKDIGFYYSHTSSPAGDISDVLIGCIINGVLYGDTSLVGINKISTEIPKEYKLYQNYPNPFNPSTKIKFSIPGVGTSRDLSVKLIIYDALGKEVTTLVNEQLKPGTYETEFDGTNLPSGVYFYKLDIKQSSPEYSGSDGYTKTKKMVLIK
jgi:hypothetical protein